jgi:uncharacterized repeat protein (TIGR03803 family)
MSRIKARLLAAAALAFPATVTTASASSYRVVYSFPAKRAEIRHGRTPEAGLVSVHGKLYGTTLYGGGANSGVVFSVKPTSGVEKIVFPFPDGGSDGDSPNGLINAGGTLYTTTNFGGIGFGAVYSINPGTRSATELYSFQGGSDGENPFAGVINVGGMLYGTTIQGGGGPCSIGCGTVFSVNPATGAEAVVYAFQGGSGGYYPAASLIDVAGTLYGTTQSGGAGSCTGGCGTVFAVNPATGAETVVYAFQGGSDGFMPTASLIDVGGTLYGTTEVGGAATVGTVFSLNPTTGAETVVHSFGEGSDGVYPSSSLLRVGDLLYGATRAGGSGHEGTLFSVSVKTGTETVLHAFTGGTDGANASGSLTNVAGTLYGTTSGLGYNQSFGTVYAYTP